MKEKNAKPSPVYSRAKTWQIALTTMTGIGQMVFYVLMTSATYIGNANFGILVAVTGVIITFSRLFDGITDPIIALVMERFKSKHGKIRFFTMIGWATMSVATTLMCNIGPKLHLEGALGIAFFVLCYVIYIIGYTFCSISGQINANVLTNDPKQRPTISVWNTAYSYLAPMIMSVVSMSVILPKFNNIQSTQYFETLNIVVIAVSFVFYLLSCIGVSKFDKPENFENIKIGKEKEEKPSFKDMVNLIKSNKELQRYIIAAGSDKLAQTIGSASVVSTMLFGIIVGSMSLSSILSAIAMLPSIIFAVIGSKIAGKKGSLKVMVDWSKICIVVNIIYAAFILFAPASMIGDLMNKKASSVALGVIIAIVFLLLNFAVNATKMVVSVATNSLRMDIVDYEFDRTGKYMPAAVSATYSFVDKAISSFGAFIATAMIGLIGYTTTVPQQGDPLTVGVKVITVVLLIGFPIIGWICTILAMKKSNITFEKMEEVQKNIAYKKSKLSQENKSEIVEETVIEFTEE